VAAAISSRFNTRLDKSSLSARRRGSAGQSWCPASEQAQGVAARPCAECAALRPPCSPH
jgi:hypothetical protein